MTKFIFDGVENILVIGRKCWFPACHSLIFLKYSITCIQRPLNKGSNESGLLQQVVFKCNPIRLISVGLLYQKWSLKVGGLLIQVVSNTGLTVLNSQGF